MEEPVVEEPVVEEHVVEEPVAEEDGASHYNVLITYPFIELLLSTCNARSS